MRRIAFGLTVFAGPTLFLVPHALAQTSQPTPEQLKAANAKFTACHNKAVATKVGPKDRRAFMKSCLAGS
jgi:psiF repeat